jgi:hypothetical protein
MKSIIDDHAAIARAMRKGDAGKIPDGPWHAEGRITEGWALACGCRFDHQAQSWHGCGNVVHSVAMELKRP